MVGGEMDIGTETVFLLYCELYWFFLCVYLVISIFSVREKVVLTDIRPTRIIHSPVQGTSTQNFCANLGSVPCYYVHTTFSSLGNWGLLVFQLICNTAKLAMSFCVTLAQECSGFGGGSSFPDYRNTWFSLIAVWTQSSAIIFFFLEAYFF